MEHTAKDHLKKVPKHKEHTKLEPNDKRAVCSPQHSCITGLQVDKEFRRERERGLKAGIFILVSQWEHVVESLGRQQSKRLHR